MLDAPVGRRGAGTPRENQAWGTFGASPVVRLPSASVNRRRVLVAVSAVQLAAGISGQFIALREQRAFDADVLGWRGVPDHVARDSWLLGTGLSAPVVMLAAQAAATTRLAIAPSRLAHRTLGLLGLAMIGGHLIEREVRNAMTPSGVHRVVTPIVAAGFGCAVAMAVLGLRRPDR